MSETTLRPPERAATTTEDPADPAPRRRARWRGALLRLHFYAGVFIGPFILIAALTGTAYALTPQLEAWLYHDELTATSPHDPLPLAEQVHAAQQVVAGAPLHAVRPAPEPGATTRVLFADPSLGASEFRTVFVDPGDGTVTGDLTTYGTSGVLPLRMTLDQLHRNLLLGEPGRIYSELAASWLWVVALAGVTLWAARRKRNRTRRRDPAPARATATRRHSRLGIAMLGGALLLSATGLTWSAYAGANIAELRTAAGWSTPEVDTSAAHREQDPHAEHRGADGDSVPGDTAAPAPSDDATVETVLAAARGAGIDASTIEIAVPERPGDAWTVSEIDRSWPTQVDTVAVDGATGEVTDRVRFADYPLGAKLARWGIDLHMGTLFGWPNQVALAAVGAGLTAVTVLGYRLWWQRRPGRAGFGRPVSRGQWRGLPRWALVAAGATAAAIGLLTPLFGLSLLVFVVVDVLIGRLAALRRRRLSHTG
ncbi:MULTISPECIES: PepSY-associated TM helix domain-containing protein [Prauserella salsuginis group]|uniref:PepSY-associated TM helix domain-containing protein n=1 Tax=Prauserella salsuginis TaxID=387889 RepID=A0ABW6G3M8_9PSEU|nr:MULTISPECIES: PepSY-associated TM helix domain-containing protein [Prauserella salsuginis group]MCR3718672.1 putative iron-regulated membrane protein [Prauserella flava]MCR3733242.1 putative iron-regulated membrane protein [Prauserella salsuginis]